MYSGRFARGYYLRSTGKVVLLGTCGFAAYKTVRGDEKFHSDILMPLVRSVDPETAHILAVKVAQYIPPYFKADALLDEELRSILQTTVAGCDFESPIGLAAGFDKDGDALPGLLDWNDGFGFVEIGSVTPEPQKGNDKPRVFRLTEDGAVINRYGFNSAGHQVVCERVKNALSGASRSRDRRRVILGVNLGKNKASEGDDAYRDFALGVRKFGALEIDYLVINVSSPNTPGLRSYQYRESLYHLLRAVCEEKQMFPNLKLFLKLSPDLSTNERAEISNVLKGFAETCIDGLIIGNTTISRPSTLRSQHHSESGGLSGAPLHELAVHSVRDFYIHTGGRIPIIGCGGVTSGADAYQLILSGASLVQLYTSLVYRGLPHVKRVKRELAELLRRDGFLSVQNAIGADVKDVLREYEDYDRKSLFWKGLSAGFCVAALPLALYYTLSR